MTSAYGGTPGTGTRGVERIPYLPLRAVLTTGRAVEVDVIAEGEWAETMDLLNDIIAEGRAWPFDERSRAALSCWQ